MQFAKSGRFPVLSKPWRKQSPFKITFIFEAFQVSFLKKTLVPFNYTGWFIDRDLEIAPYIAPFGSHQINISYIYIVCIYK